MGRQPGEQHNEAVAEYALFRVAATSARDAIVTIDGHSTILFANPSTEELFGHAPEKLVGKSLTMLMPDYLRKVHEAAIERYLATGEKRVHWGRVELPGLHRNGQELPLELSFGETTVDGNRIFTGVIRDVSERKRLERRWEAQYSVALILAKGEDLQVTAGEILETICKCLDWQVGVFWQPGDGGELLATRQWSVLDTGAERFLEATSTTPLAPGIGVPGRVAQSLEPLWLADVEVDDNFPRQAFAQQANLHAVFAFPIRTAGELVGVMEFYSSEIRKPDASLLNLMKSTAVQIGQFSERLRAQLGLRDLNADLERRVAERTAQLEKSTDELESFVYSVSHDLRAPLRGIDGFSQLLLEEYSTLMGPTAADFLARIRKAAGRMGTLIDELLNLSRITQSELKAEPVDLSEIASQVQRELEQRYPDRKVEIRIAPGRRAIGDPQLLSIVLDNLLGNSWKFTEHVERPRIEFDSEENEGREVFHVRDNGAGFDMAYVDKLFRPFQRLHSPDQFEGSGIGLTTVQRIVHRHGGEIWADADVGKGATFYFTLG